MKRPALKFKRFAKYKTQKAVKKVSVGAKAKNEILFSEFWKITEKLEEMCKVMDLQMEILSLLKDILTDAQVRERPVEEADDEESLDG